MGDKIKEKHLLYLLIVAIQRHSCFYFCHVYVLVHALVCTVNQVHSLWFAHNYLLLVNALCDIFIMTCPALSRLAHTVTTLRLDHLMLTDLLSSLSV